MKNYVVESYENYQEENRLSTNNARRIEFLTTTRIFDELLKGSRDILDCETGTGVYAFYLADQGYNVTATDITPRHIDIIRKQLETKNYQMKTSVLDATDMSIFKDESFDVVLNMGPFYHLTEAVRKLGYPDATSLKHWYREYSQTRNLHEGKRKYSKYSDSEKRAAVDYYFEHGQNALKTVKGLGYLSRPLLLTWITELHPKEGERRCKQFKSHVRCSQEEKIQAVMESCKGTLKISQIAEIYNVTPSAVSIWRKELLGDGRTIKMTTPSETDKDIDELIREKTELEAKVKRLEHDVYKLQLEHDVLEKAGDILKKEKGINLDGLTNREKVFLIDALRCKYKLNELLQVLKLSKSSYCYQVNSIHAVEMRTKFWT